MRKISLLILFTFSGFFLSYAQSQNNEHPISIDKDCNYCKDGKHVNDSPYNISIKVTVHGLKNNFSAPLTVILPD